ncbi:glycosyltransferase family A protein [Chitinophaga flava]|uniref:Glycosyltransferase 2-like domain-containing protein n=1 Tax=Chitinophaga flava TaxID=2259036 RepID=A0A365XSZ0_9BACT|nr:glycosyltransferase family A protein [Chitinophaga flava]RBL89453.1 hypothetical protein DF182_23345 [Chitinophaga flava]
MQEFNIHIIVPFRNVRNHIERCLQALLSQQYNLYTVHFLDDCSDDGTSDLIPDDIDYISKKYNPERYGPLKNIWSCLTNNDFEDEDIIAIVDGDDFLIGEYSLQVVNYYHNQGALVTYGQYIDNYGFLGHCHAYSESDFQDLRKADWKASHLKTFRYKVFRELLRQDPSANAFKDNNGDFLTFTGDMALMLPLLEIAGLENTQSCSQVLYCYRRHENNEHATEAQALLQKEAEQCIRSKPPFSRYF